MITDQLELLTVGIDIGSATTHLAFSAIKLERMTQHLSSKFVVVSREIVSESPVLLTPFLEDGLIDVEELEKFIGESYESAGLDRQSVDSGAVILTGRALIRRNARAVADLFSSAAGDFVCAEAGHLLEAELAAYGSGAVELSKAIEGIVLNIDIGGGTTKISMIRAGQIISTAAFAVGGRLVAWDDDDVISRLEWPIEQVAAGLGIDLSVGIKLADIDKDDLGKDLAYRLFDSLFLRKDRGETTSEVELWLTNPIGGAAQASTIVFSGGVSEYIYDLRYPMFGDLSPFLAGHMSAYLSAYLPSIEIVDPHETIRATVIGASQFTTQVSGSTITISDQSILPIHNLPVMRLPESSTAREPSSVEIAAQIEIAVQRRIHGDHQTMLGIGMSWRGIPHYANLVKIAAGLVSGLQCTGHRGIVLLCDADVGRTLGRIMHEDLSFDGPIVALDGLEVGAFDFVDVGMPFTEQSVVPVTVKSLLFS